MNARTPNIVRPFGTINQFKFGQEQTVPIGIYWVLCLFFIFEYVRPQDALDIPAFKIPITLGVILAIAWLARGDRTILKDALVRCYIGFIVLMAGSVVFVGNHTAWLGATRILILYLITVVLPVTAFLREPDRFLRFMRLWIAIHVVIAVWVITHGGKGPGGELADENDVALALNIGIPYAWFLMQSPRVRGVGKLLFLVAVAIMVLGAIATFSRGGFLGLVPVLGTMWLFSTHRIRNLLIGGIMIFAIILFFPQGYVEEMQTISDPISAPSLRTGQERLYTWRRGWEMYLDNPVFGVGAGNFPWRVLEYEVKAQAHEDHRGRFIAGRKAHSLYFTLIPELGTVGIVLYASIVIIIFRKLINIIRTPEPDKETQKIAELRLLAKAMAVSLIGFLISGIFISVLYYRHLWYLIGFVLALEGAVKMLAGPITNKSLERPASC